MSGRIEAIVFDLFGTIVEWNPDALPEMELRGKPVRTTIPLLVPILEEALDGRFDLDRTLDAYFDVLGDLAAEREREGIEISCHDRFARVLRRLDAPGDVEATAERLTRTHMAEVRRVTAAPPERVEVVRRLARDFRIGLLSNFDDTATGHQIVDDTGLRELFETVVISAEVGLRKPNPRIFERVLETLALEPAAVLFVGDTPADDVAGAAAVGMPVVWLDAGKPELPEGIVSPDWTIPDLTGLPEVIERAGVGR